MTLESTDRRTPDGRSAYDPQRTLGQVVRALRRERGVSQKDFADRIGISQSWLSRIESGAYDPPWSSVLRVIDGFGISLEELDREIKTYDQSMMAEGKH